MKKIDKNKLQNRLDENLKSLFKPYVDDTIRGYEISRYYHFLDEDFYSFLDKYFEDVDSVYWENLEGLKDKLGQYIYISHWGEPFDKEGLIKLKEEGTFDDSAFAFYDLKSLNDMVGWRSDEIKDYEPINHNDICELVLIKSFLEIYNDTVK